MKKIFLYAIALVFMCSCGDEPKPVPPSYDRLLTFVECAPSLESLAKMALAVEGHVASSAADFYGEELPDSFVASRDRFHATVENEILKFKKGHFVELRTVVYGSAADVAGTAWNEAGKNAMHGLLKQCSAALYIDGQRACDPPYSVRKRYEQAKEKVYGQM